MKNEISAECSSCGGSGVYTGFAEKEGAAVVCSSCSGTGCQIIRYIPFTSRHKKAGVSVIFKRNMGRVLGPMSVGGLSYKNWLEGKPFPKGEDRENYCPAWWFQSMDYDKKPQWDECIGCGAFTDCESYKKKAKCWERFDIEAGKRENKNK